MVYWKELAFFIYKLYRWFNWVSIALIRLFKRDLTLYFIIANDGSQIPFTALDYAVMQPTYLLIIYYSSSGTKYRFVTPVVEYGEDARQLAVVIESAYRNYDEPDFTFLGMSVSIDDCHYPLPPAEFMVVGSTLFSTPFNYWLCKHYLNIQPCEQIVATFIDDDVRMVAVTSDVLIMRDKYAVKQI